MSSPETGSFRDTDCRLRVRLSFTGSSLRSACPADRGTDVHSGCSGRSAAPAASPLVRAGGGFVNV